ncbi:MAG: acyltransferase [Verrucomicrobiae bacterium]|nr:acyltransferase [Verrucomicrobiae bacterium]
MKDSPASPPETLAALTGLRGFAAFWVVSLHFMGDTNTLLPASAGLNWLMGAGANAVPLFFILSGFILLHTYRARFEIFSWGEYLRFLGLRLARIYPAYLAALAAMGLLVCTAPLVGAPFNHAAYPLRWLLPEALMLHNWVVVVVPPHFSGWNYPDWSVSAEWFAYLFIFPLAAWLLKKISRRGNLLVAALALAVLALEPAVHTEWKLSMVSLLFLAGALLWELRRRQLAAGKKIFPHLDSAGVALLLAAVSLAAVHGGWPAYAGILVASGLLVFGLAQAGGIFSRLLALRGCVFLGQISYSIYLIHGVVQRLLKVTLPSQKFAGAALPVRTGVFLMDIALILLAALLLYFLVEQPARAWLHRKFSRPQTHR